MTEGRFKGAAPATTPLLIILRAFEANAHAIIGREVVLRPFGGRTEQDLVGHDQQPGDRGVVTQVRVGISAQLRVRWDSDGPGSSGYWLAARLVRFVDE